MYDEKYDGWRMVAIKTNGTARFVSRNGRDLATRFPELVNSLSGLKPRAFILDGEVAVYDRAGGQQDRISPALGSASCLRTERAPQARPADHGRIR